MKEEIEVLEFINLNVKMGIFSIDGILKYVENDKLIKILEKQKREYEVIEKKAIALLKKANYSIKEISDLTKKSTKVMMNMKMLVDYSASNIAKMTIKGTNMGIIAITQKINNYKISDDKILNLAIKLKTTLEKNIEELKKYL